MMPGFEFPLLSGWLAQVSLAQIPLAQVEFEDIIRLLFLLGVGYSMLPKGKAAGKKASKPKPPPQSVAGRPQPEDPFAMPGSRAGGPPPPPQGSRPDQRVGQPAGNRPPMPNRVEDEIEAFLQQARRKPQAETPVNQPVVPAGSPIVAQADPDLPHEDYVPGQRFGRGVADHVSEHLAERLPGDGPQGHLAGNIERADERIEQHLGDVFDHDVGSLQHQDDVDTKIKEGTDAMAWEHDQPDWTEPSLADQIRKTMQSPQDVRQALVIAEILKRPQL